MSRNKEIQKTVKPFYMPTSLVATQAGSICYFSYLTRWRRLFPWLFKGIRTLPTAAGAVGMGCIGFPIHPVWEVTAACNLKCRHCHVNAGKHLGNELDTEESKKLIIDIAKVPEFRMLVFTGGEPLVRPDILELTEVASATGLTVSVATNATLIDTAMAKKMKRAGVWTASRSFRSVRSASNSSSSINSGASSARSSVKRSGPAKSTCTCKSGERLNGVHPSAPTVMPLSPSWASDCRNESAVAV